ncbi:MAG: UPF0149 family protein [Gammaproteobacteria bacterium]|nr:UPF0149 family protein [Gammaproteobacteria bacterium]
MSQIPLDYEHVCEALMRVNATAEAAESHGIMCGMLCAKGEISAGEWVAYLVEDELEGANVLAQEAVGLLHTLHARTYEQVTGIGFELALLLPDDDSDIQQRIETLSLWCQGFLVGLSVGGVTDLDELPADSQEIALDMIQISQAGMDAEEEDEPNEAAYAEVVEYVRMGVLVIYSEMNPPPEAPPEVRLH